MRCYRQNIKALGLPLSEKKNSEICLLCSYAQTCEPHGRTSPDPRDIIWTNLAEVHMEMLHTKYQGSRLSSLRVKELWNFRSLFLCSTCDPQGGASFDPRGILWTNLLEVHKDMPHTKYQISTQSSFREEKFWKRASLFLYSKLWPLGWGQFWPQGSSRKCYVPNIKALGLPVSEINNFEIFLLCSFVPTCGPVLTGGGRASYEQTW